MLKSEYTANKALSETVSRINRPGIRPIRRCGNCESIHIIGKRCMVCGIKHTVK